MTKLILYKIYREILFQKVASRYLLHFVQNGSSKRMGGLLQNGPLSSPGPREGHFGAPLTHFWPKRSYRVMFLVFVSIFRYLSAKTPSFGSRFGGHPQHAYFGAALTHFWPKQSYRAIFVFTFSGTSQLKHLVLRAFWARAQFLFF